jgi:hypothetical protein
LGIYRVRTGGGRIVGKDPFVEVEWDTALAIVAEEPDRVRREHGNSAIYRGSYGWASAGRFHHAQGQLRRFLNLAGMARQRTMVSVAWSLQRAEHGEQRSWAAIGLAALFNHRSRRPPAGSSSSPRELPASAMRIARDTPSGLSQKNGWAENGQAAMRCICSPISRGRGCTVNTITARKAWSPRSPGASRSPFP